jgi:tetratricopeptide (TPR) repeat protein
MMLAIGLGSLSAVRHLRAWGHWRDAQRALERHDLAAAREHLDRALEIWPDSASTHFQAARTARRMGLYDEAKVHLIRCEQLRWHADSIKLEFELARAQRGDLAGLEEKLLADVDQGHPDSVLILEALCRGYMGDYLLASKALRCLNQWLDRDPEAVQGLLWRGQLRCAFHDYVGGLADYKGALELDPDNDDIRLRLAEAWLEALAPAEAVNHFEHVLVRQPENPAALLGLARCRRELSQTDQANQLLDTLLRLEPQNAAALRERSSLALNAGQSAQAERWLRRAVHLDPYDETTNLLLSECLLRLDRERGRGFAPTVPWVFLYRWLHQVEAQAYRARYEFMLQDGERLKSLMAQVVKHQAHDAEVYYQIGTIHLRLGRLLEARAWLQMVLYLDSRHEHARQALQECQRRASPP